MIQRPPASPTPAASNFASAVKIVLLAMLFALAATLATIWLQRGNRTADAGGLPALFEAPAFSMTAQDGQTVSKADLAGKVWIADFIFTTCRGPCPMMSQKLAELSKQITQPNVRFVSFTVDPKTDTPQVLTDYARTYDADHARWILLTAPGTSYLDIAEGFKVAAKPAEGEHPILHSSLYFLVDQQGKVRGTYKWNDEKSIQQLITDAAELAGQ